MLGGMNPAKIQGMMKKMGISQVPLDAKRVIFEMKNSKIIIDKPSVIKVKMQGQESYQITGEAREETEEIFSEEDVKIVIEKTGKTEEEVKKILEKTKGDIAEAIMELKE